MNSSLLRRLPLLAALLLLALPSLAHAATLTVALDGSGQYSKIQDAINAAQSGDSVLVGDGTYTGDGNRDLDFNGKSLTIKSVNGATKTIIDCQGTNANPHRGFYIHSGETDAIINGFTIENGYAFGDMSDFLDSSGVNDGGGVDIISSSANITNCSFSHNNAVYNGGAIGINGSSATISDCSFSGSISSHNGGAVATYGSTVAITKCGFSGSMSGRITYIGDESDPVGGAVYADSSDTNISGCIFDANSALDGGGVYAISSSLTVTNCAFTNNASDYYGGTIYADSSSPYIINCTFSNNSAADGTGLYAKDSTIIIVNSILRNKLTKNGIDEIDYYDSSVTANQSDIQGGYPGTGNIDADPLFVNAAAGDLHLQSGSPCFGAGIPNGAPTTDLDGNTRPNPPSIGTYDLPSTPYYSLTDLGTFGGPTSFAYAINNQGQVIGEADGTDNNGGPFLFSGNGLQNLLPPGYSNLTVSGLNDAGQIVGRAQVGMFDRPTACLISGGAVTLLPFPSGTNASESYYDESDALGINNSGQIVGSASYGERSHPVIWNNGVPTDLTSDFPGVGSLAVINDVGQAAGYKGYGFNSTDLVFWQPSKPLQTIDSSGQVTGINKYGNVVGGANGSDAQGYFWSNSDLRTLGTLGGAESFAYGLNDMDQVVGYSTTSDNKTHAFLYSGDQMTDLNTRIIGTTEFELNEATGINNHGQICGWGTVNGHYHAFLLTPVQASISAFSLSPNQISAAGATVTADVTPQGNFSKVTVSPAPGTLGSASPTFSLTYNGTDWVGPIATAYLKLAKTNPVTFIATGTRADGSTATAQATLTIGALPTLSLSASCDKSTVPAGQTFWLRGFVRNLTSATADNVIVTIPLPSHLTFVSSPDFTYNASQGTITWKGSLAANIGSHAINIEFQTATNTPSNTPIIIDTTASATNFQTVTQSANIVVDAPPVPVGIDIDAHAADDEANGAAIITSTPGTPSLQGTISPVSTLNYAWLGVDEAVDASGAPLTPTTDASLGSLAAQYNVVGPGISPTYMASFPRVGSQCVINLKLTSTASGLNIASLILTALSPLIGPRSGTDHAKDVIDFYEHFGQLQSFTDAAYQFDHPATSKWQRVVQVATIGTDILKLSSNELDEIAIYFSGVTGKVITTVALRRALVYVEVGLAVIQAEQTLAEIWTFKYLTGDEGAQITFRGSANSHPEEFHALPQPPQRSRSHRNRIEWSEAH